MANTPELILPAADLNKTKYAFMYGADTVYGGLPGFSLRKAEVNFTLKTLSEAIDYAHNLKNKFYITLNIFPKNNQIDTLKKEIVKLAKLNPDAFIISDPGLIQVAKKLAPKVRIHLSTQANTLNYESVKFWKSQGVKRIVLARELTLKEIAEIKKKVPAMELECFVHGAMCISYSGRCLMSSFMTGRESNQGLCTQPCRWQYRAVNSKQITDNKKIRVNPSIENPCQSAFLEEKQRPGEYFPIEEDVNGTYIMNSKDLCLIEHLEELQKAGVSAFKVEGRNKSEYYVSIAAKSYRQAIETISNSQYPISKKKNDLKKLKEELETLNYRDYTTGFIFGKAKLMGETYNDRAPIRKYEFVGVVESQLTASSKQLTGDIPFPVILATARRPESEQSQKKYDSGQARMTQYRIQVRNKIKKNDTLEIITPTETVKFKIKDFYNLRKEKIAEASHGNKNSYIFAELPKVPIGSLIRKKLK
ncbi:peptidase U32 [bacterium (Candidatus Howlettbacteria) CG_4_10_14_0_8_um_filter_40_9]|nr:MAG: peptidase U32 [bacterium (Candidatus Howlettbacteria) CG_4_10_14_0_8_um_filter_40_9]